MKTTIIVAVLILNTTLLFIGPLAELAQSINPWFFAITETILLVGFLTHRLLQDLKKTFDIDIDDLKIFLFKDLN